MKYIEHALTELKKIDTIGDYGELTQLAMLPVLAFCLCIASFGGRWYDALLASAMGLLVGVLSRFAERCVFLLCHPGLGPSISLIAYVDIDIPHSDFW